MRARSDRQEYVVSRLMKHLFRDEEHSRNTIGTFAFILGLIGFAIFLVGYLRG
jgi:hypothetical protein